MYILYFYHTIVKAVQFSLFKIYRAIKIGNWNISLYLIKNIILGQKDIFVGYKNAVFFIINTVKFK